MNFMYFGKHAGHAHVCSVCIFSMLVMHFGNHAGHGYVCRACIFSMLVMRIFPILYVFNFVRILPCIMRVESFRYLYIPTLSILVYGFSIVYGFEFA